MKDVTLTAHGLLAVLALEPSNGGWTAKLTQHAARAACVTGCACAVTLGIASMTRGLLDEEGARGAVEAMIAPDRGRTEQTRGALEAIESELGAAMKLRTVPSEDGRTLAVTVAVGDDPTETTDVCASKSRGAHTGAACLMRVLPAFGDATPEGLEDLLIKIEFPTTAYVLGHLVIEAARQRNPDAEFTLRRKAKILEAVETVLGNNPFVPSNPEVAWAARLNGPFQLATYFLAAVALTMIAIAWTNSVVTNWAVRSMRKVAIEVTERREAMQDEDDATRGRAATVVRNEPTPWADDFTHTCSIDPKDAKEVSEYYEKVNKAIRDRSAVLGVRINPPILRLGRAAARAVANTDDTSIVPVFLDGQREAIAGLHDARMSIVRFLLWVIPTVGFVGTVLGVSAALGATVGVQATREVVSGLAQSTVSASMGIAFDTTLVALVATMIVMLVYHWAQGTEDRMTVLERNRAEEDATDESRIVRKPGTPGDIAAQLAALGINSKRLTEEITVLVRSGPEIEAIIEQMRRHNARIEMARGADRAGNAMSRWVWAVLIVAAVLSAGVILALNGMLGETIEDVTRTLVKTAAESARGLVE